MPEDTSVQISFSASTDEAIAGIAQIHEALSALMALISSMSGSLDRLGSSLGAALPIDRINQCAKSVSSVGAAAQIASDGVRGMGTAARQAAAQAREIGAETKLLQQSLEQKKILLNAEVSQYQITQNQKYALLETETQKEFDTQLVALQNGLMIANLSAQQKQGISDKIQALEAKHQTDMLRLDEQSIAAQQALWNGYLSAVTGAFNSQLRGLLEGTTNWHKAMRKMLEDLTIKFIEMAEQMVEKWLAAELAKTTATTTGAAARAEAEQTASSSGILANAANAMQAILTDAAQAFAGVFAFLAPTMGPAAAGPAAAAQASISAAAIYDVGTNYVVRGGLAVIHPGETIVPAGMGWSAGSGPYTGGVVRPGGGSAGDTHFHIAALDAQSVSRFFNDNAGHMMRAINKAIKSGTHLNPRYAR